MVIYLVVRCAKGLQQGKEDNFVARDVVPFCMSSARWVGEMVEQGILGWPYPNLDTFSVF